MDGESCAGNFAKKTTATFFTGHLTLQVAKERKKCCYKILEKIDSTIDLSKLQSSVVGTVYCCPLSHDARTHATSRAVIQMKGHATTPPPPPYSTNFNSSFGTSRHESK